MAITISSSHSLVAQSTGDCIQIDDVRNERARFADFMHSHSASFFSSPHSLVPDAS